MKLRECNAIIIHLGRASVERKPYVDKLCELFPSHHVLDAIDSEKLTRVEIEYYDQLVNFKRMPTLNKISLYARVACFLSHKMALEYIIKNRLNNCIIFEDDAVCDDESFLDTEVPSDYDIIYLGYNVYTSTTPKTKKTTTKIISSHAILYTNWEYVSRLHTYMCNNRRKWKSWDLFMNDFVLPTTSHLLLNTFSQMSPTTKSYVSFSKTNNNWGIPIANVIN